MSAYEKLRESIKNDIKRFDKESQDHKSIHRRCQTATIALAAATTIVAGAGLILPESAGKTLQFIVLCLTASTTGVTAWAEMRRVRDLWQHEREIYYALSDIEREIEFVAAARELSESELNLYFHKATAVLSSSSQKWVGIQERKEGSV